MSSQIPLTARMQILHIWKNHSIYCFLFAIVAGYAADRIGIKSEGTIVAIGCSLIFAFAFVEMFDLMMQTIEDAKNSESIDVKQKSPE